MAQGCSVCMWYVGFPGINGAGWVAEWVDRWPRSWRRLFSGWIVFHFLFVDICHSFGSWQTMQEAKRNEWPI